MVVADFGYCSCARLQNVSRGFFFLRIVFVCSQNGHHLQEDVEKVGNYLKKDLAKPGYKSKHESTKRWGWLEWRSHGSLTELGFQADRARR